MTYIAFLRGINVGGHTVKMVRLRALFAELGFTNVRSYIQSGNVFFETDETDRELLTGLIEGHLHAALGFSAVVLLRTVPEIQHILDLDPFGHVAVTPDIRLCIMFTAGALHTDQPFPIYTPKGDVEIVGATGGEVFFVSRIVNGVPADPTKLIEAAFNAKGLKLTTRYFGTTAKILQAARQA